MPFKHDNTQRVMRSSDRCPLLTVGRDSDVEDDLAAGVTALAESMSLADLARGNTVWITGFIRPSSMSWPIDANCEALDCTKTKRC